MLAQNKRIIIATLAFFLTISAALPTRAQESDANFNPDNIITDQELLDANAMSLAEIDAFLKSQGGFIATNKFEDAFGVMRSAAEIIYNAAHNYECPTIEQYRSYTLEQKQSLCSPATINPKLLLVLLQKEQSLIEAKSPTQKALDWATGYAVCDSCSMSDPRIQRFRGFGKQINSGALQFFDYMSNPQNYRYRAGQTYTVDNTGRPASVITPLNQATAALYNYTPHVYNGNYNFWKLWQRYFTREYLNGSLLQAKGEAGVWLIENGVKRPFLSKSALTSRFDITHIQTVSKADLDKYPTGAPIKFSQYSIVRIPTGQIYLLVNSTKRHFSSMEAFRKIGFNPEEIIQAGAGDLDAYTDGPAITEASLYPTGALLQNKTNGGVYWVENSTKAPIWDAALLRTAFKNRRIIQVSEADLAKYETVGPVTLSNGDLVRTAANPTVYVIENGLRRPFISAATFEKLGYKWTNVVTVSEKLLGLHPEGAVVSVAQY